MWRRQPQRPAKINWSNPLTRGLICAVNAAAGPFDAVTGKALDLNGTAPASNIGLLGIGWGNATAGNNWSLPDLSAKIAETNEATMLFLLQGGTTANQGFGNYDTDNSDGHYPYDGLIYLDVLNGGRWLNGVASAIDITLPHVLVCQCKNGTWRATQNGVVLGTSTSAVNPSWPAATQAHIGLSPGSGMAYSGSKPLILVWNRYLTDAEAAQFSMPAACWQVLIQPAIRPVTASGLASVLPRTVSVLQAVWRAGIF